MLNSAVNFYWSIRLFNPNKKKQKLLNRPATGAFTLHPKRDSRILTKSRNTRTINTGLNIVNTKIIYNPLKSHVFLCLKSFVMNKYMDKFLQPPFC